MNSTPYTEALLPSASNTQESSSIYGNVGGDVNLGVQHTSEQSLLRKLLSPVSRLVQLDAESLDNDIVNQLAMQFHNAQSQLDNDFLTRWRPEFDLVVRTLLFWHTIWSDRPTLGSLLLNQTFTRVPSRFHSFGDSLGHALQGHEDQPSYLSTEGTVNPQFYNHSFLTGLPQRYGVHRVFRLLRWWLSQPFRAFQDKKGVRVLKPSSVSTPGPRQIGIIPLSTGQKLTWYFLAIFARYVWSRLWRQTDMVQNQTWKPWLQYIAEKVELLVRIIHVANFTAFIVHGEFRSPIDRQVGMAMIPLQPLQGHSQQPTNLEQQLIWGVIGNQATGMANSTVRMFSSPAQIPTDTGGGHCSVCAAEQPVQARVLSCSHSACMYCAQQAVHNAIPCRHCHQIITGHK